MADSSIIILVNSQTMAIQYFENPILLGCDALNEHIVSKILKNQSTFKSTQHLIEMSTRNISRGLMQSVCTADKLTNCLYCLSGNLGTSTSWNPKACPGLYWDCFAFFAGPLQQWEILAQLSITSH